MSELQELVRANKITVVAMNGENNGYRADFYRTHKQIKGIESANTEWVTPTDTTKTGERESFRQFMVQNAETFGILWKPEDIRSDENKRRPKYETNEQLTEDAMAMIIPDIQALLAKCKYPVEWGGLEFEEIVPMTKTGKGTDLSALGIEDGKYKNSGNWAWATIKMIATLKYNKEEFYTTVMIELVSGQLKKPKLGIQIWNDTMKNEIMDAGLATAEQLDPPKDTPKDVVVNLDTEGEKIAEIIKAIPKEETVIKAKTPKKDTDVKTDKVRSRRANASSKTSK